MSRLVSSASRTERWSRPAIRDIVARTRDSGCRASETEPLARHLSMGIGGPCAAMLWPRDVDIVSDLLAWMSERALPWRTLGGGTNLLAPSKGVGAAILNLTEMTGPGAWSHDHARLPAGMTTGAAVRQSIDRGLAGLVWATGLPGTVGGAAAGNAGCWGNDMGSTVEALELARPDGEREWVQANRLAWGYRSLDIDAAGGTGAVIVAVRARLQAADAGELRSQHEELHEIKRERQPVGARNAGCIFRNPAGERSAGELIDLAGCKGLRVGDAEVSTMHANFILNRGGATAEHVDELIDLVDRRVADRFGFRLQPEIRRW